MKKLIRTIAFILLLSVLIAPATAFADKGAAAAAFTQYLDQKDVIYTYQGKTDSGKDRVKISYDCENTSLTAQFVFDTDDEAVAVYIFNLYEARYSQIDDCKKLCNDMNAKYRFVKFYLDEKDNTITVQADAIFRSHDIGDICYELLLRSLDIADEAYPSFAELG